MSNDSSSELSQQRSKDETSNSMELLPSKGQSVLSIQNAISIEYQEIEKLKKQLFEANKRIHKLQNQVKVSTVYLLDSESDGDDDNSSSSLEGPEVGTVQEKIRKPKKNYLWQYFAKWKGETVFAKVPCPTVSVIFWSFIGSFCGIAVVGLLHTYIFSEEGRVGWIGSMGAAAILLYGTQSPLGQPKNVFFGNLISAVIGVSMRFAFINYPNLIWLAGALAVSISMVAMHLTKTLHPPGGATALIAVADNNVWSQEWFYIVVPVMLGYTVMIFVALVIMNIKLRFPKYWWDTLEC